MPRPRMVSTSPRRLRWASVALALLALAGCADKAASPTDLDLSTRLSVKQARAGRIRSPHELIGGPTARGKVGDFKLYNAKVSFIVGAEGARGNGYSQFGGKLVDADRVRAPGEAGRSNFGEWSVGFDQNVSSAERVSVVSDGTRGGPAVVRVEGAATRIPFFVVILDGVLPDRDLGARIQLDYILEPDAEHLRVEATVHNPSASALPVQMRQMGLVMGDGADAFLPGAGFTAQLTTVPYFAAVAQDVSYGLFDESPMTFIFDYQSFLIVSLGGFEVPARGTRTFTTLVAVGDGDTASLVRIHARATGTALPGPELTGQYLSSAGSPLAGARVHAVRTDVNPPTHAGVAKSGADGRFALPAAPGTYELRATDASRPQSLVAAVTVPPTGAPPPAALRAPTDGTIAFTIRDAAGAPLPAKLTVRNLGAASPALPKAFGTQLYTGGAPRVVAAHTGQGRITVDAGRYRIVASRGFEYELVTREVEVPAGGTADAAFTLRRVMDTSGYLSGDFHIHAQASADSSDTDEAKAAMFAAEGLEVAVSTDHEFRADYAPAIERLGLRPWVRSIVGEEVTTFNFGHFNAFPLAVDLSKANQGFVPWYFKTGGALFDFIHEDAGGPLVQINHPRGGDNYFSQVGFEPATGTVSDPRNWSTDFEAVEVANGKGGADPFSTVQRDWHGLLNMGLRVTGTGNSDSHAAYQGDEVAFPRNFVAVPSDDVAAFDEAAFVAAVRGGKVVVSGGPFLRVSVGGRGLGELVTAAPGQQTVAVEVQAPEWMGALSELVVIANGREVARRELSFSDVASDNPTRRFRGELTFSAERDAWLIVHVSSRSGTLDPVYSGGSRPFAFTNPIWLDVDGNGRFDAPLPQ